MFLLSLLLSLKLSTYIAVSPATIVARMYIPPDQINRGACILVDGENYFDESCWSLNGENERGSWERVWRRVPGGNYIAILTLRTTKGDRFVKVEFEVRD